MSCGILPCGHCAGWKRHKKLIFLQKSPWQVKKPWYIMKHTRWKTSGERSMWQLSSVGRAMDWKSMCPRFDPGSGHHFFCPNSGKKTWSLKRLCFVVRQNRFIRRSRASCTAGALHKTPFQMKQLHFIPLWSICFSQIWSTSLWRCLYNKEFFVLNSPFGEFGERQNDIKQSKFSVLPFSGTPRLRSNMRKKCVSGRQK